jgi:hypothetical protein
MSRTSDGSHPARPSANSINRSATTKIVDRLLLLKFNTVNCFHIDLRSGLEASAGIRLRPAARRRKATGTGKALLQKSTHHAPVRSLPVGRTTHYVQKYASPRSSRCRRYSASCRSLHP